MLPLAVQTERDIEKDDPQATSGTAQIVLR